MTPGRAVAALLLALGALAPGAAREASAKGVDYQDDWVARASAAADIDGDGTPDLVIAQQYLTEGPQQGRVLVHYGDPANPGRYSVRDELPCGTNPAGIVVQDLDGNLLVDIVTLSALDGSATVLLHTVPALFVRSDFAAVERGTGIAAGDLNDDGLADLAVSGRDELAILFQDSGAPGAFLPAVPAPTAEEPTCVAVGDVDGDGFQDLVYGVRDGLGYQTQIAVAPGTFAGELLLAMEARRIGRIVAGDLDGDGRDDFAVASKGNPTFFNGAGVSVLLHQPGGGLVFDERTVTTGPQQDELVVVDMDGDAVPDLVSAGARTVAWHRQDPAAPGTFKKVKGGQRSLSAGDGPLAVADFDGNGAPDPIVAFFGPFLVPRKANKPNKFATPKRYRPSN